MIDSQTRDQDQDSQTAPIVTQKKDNRIFNITKSISY
jgi:hypothetical protein